MEHRKPKIFSEEGYKNYPHHLEQKEQTQPSEHGLLLGFAKAIIYGTILFLLIIGINFMITWVTK